MKNQLAHKQPKDLTVGDVAEILQVSRRMVRNLIKEGKLKAYKPLKRAWRIPREALEQYRFARMSDCVGLNG